MIEMAQFSQYSHYARLRLEDGDDPGETLQAWGRFADRWEHSAEKLMPVLASTRDEVDTWASSEDRDLVQIYHGPWPNPASQSDLPKLVAFALRLALNTPIDPDDCCHVAYVLRYADGVITSDAGLISAVQRSLQTPEISATVKTDYVDLFGVKFPEPEFAVFKYPTELERLEAWGRLDTA